MRSRSSRMARRFPFEVKPQVFDRSGCPGDGGHQLQLGLGQMVLGNGWQWSEPPGCRCGWSAGSIIYLLHFRFNQLLTGRVLIWAVRRNTAIEPVWAVSHQPAP